MRLGYGTAVERAALVADVLVQQAVREEHDAVAASVGESLVEGFVDALHGSVKDVSSFEQ